MPHSYGMIGKTPLLHTIYSDASLQGRGGGHLRQLSQLVENGPTKNHNYI